MSRFIVETKGTAVVTSWGLTWRKGPQSRVEPLQFLHVFFSGNIFCLVSCVLSVILSLWFKSFVFGGDLAHWVKLSLNLQHRHQKVSSAFCKNMENSGHFKVHFYFLCYMKEKKLPFGTAVSNIFPWMLGFFFFSVISSRNEENNPYFTGLFLWGSL